MDHLFWGPGENPVPDFVAVIPMCGGGESAIGANRGEKFWDGFAGFSRVGVLVGFNSEEVGGCPVAVYAGLSKCFSDYSRLLEFNSNPEVDYRVEETLRLLMMR